MMDCHVGPSMEAGGGNDDAPSPRTLRAAAERLTQYTPERSDAGPPAGLCRHILQGAQRCLQHYVTSQTHACGLVP